MSELWLAHQFAVVWCLLFVSTFVSLFITACLNDTRRVCLISRAAGAPAQFACASPWSVLPGAGVRQRGGHRPERQRTAEWAGGRSGGSTSQHLQLRLQVIQWRFASAKRHSADVRECLYILEGKKRHFLCSCPQLLVPECCSGERESCRRVSALAQDGCSSSVVHGIIPAGEVTLRKTSIFVERVMWPVPVALRSTKCMQSQKRSSLWSTWSRRCFVSPPMADLHKTGLLISPSL